MLNMLNPMALEEETNKKLTEFIQNVHDRDFVWMDEILEEAIKMFKSSSFNGEPELMPKTPSQKNRSRKKCLSSMKNDQLATRRSSKRNSARIRASKRISQNTQRKKELEIQKAELENISPCVRVTRSQAARSFKSLSVAVKNPVIDLAKGRIPLVEISANERHSAEGQIENTPPQLAKVALSHTLSSSPAKRSKPLSENSVIIIQDTPEEKLKKEVGRTACKLKIANVCLSKTIENEAASIEKLFPEQQADKPLSEPKATLNLNESPQTPTVCKGSRRSVRRSLMGRASTSSRASLANRYSLSTKREQIVLRRSSRTVSKQSIQQSSVHTHAKTEAIKEVFPDKESTESRATLDSTSHSQKVDENLNKTLCSNKTGMPETPQSEGKQHKGDREDAEDSSEMSDELQKQPLSARRKPSYKRAISDRDDGQHTEDELSPPRKKTLSPQCPASKVVRPFKTFLHTVQKNQMLMTPASVNRNNTIKSFLRQNTPLRFTPREKERQRLENLRKKEEAEHQRKRKMEEEKKRRLEEMKRKREERLQKVLQARERVEQLEEEKKKRLEQKLAQHEEKNEKVREEKMAEGKIKKRAVAKKLEELEARRKQEEDARKQRALQLEEEERRHKELMQKKREEEQERARKIAEQHQAELEREKELSAKRELEKKQEQEKIQAQRKHEQQEKEKAARLQREVLQAAKEKERLRKEMEEKEWKLQEQRKQEEELLKTTSEAQAKVANKQLNVTVTIENSPLCNSYPMTPQGPKQPKIDINNYGMDLNSDDSTDDESQPRKTIPAWASGNQLSQVILHQYYNPPNTKALFGVVKSPKLEEIFDKSKPRYFKRTSSAVWNSPPFQGGKSVSSAFKRF
ncbi:inner centromere protein isoform X1 [Pantherophis guttatus]|uniref:Inner centromere protein isoform X1 n=1 Tax=Pantherophis guttatus TaxID=94885 RepID=A0A6P9BXJ9_PANGU|nr:inner centromere protein isoform X1 [Pantherophis guttatus]XP_060543762.1 inner centromere protein isoform X1 [Pantherophis guttatus]